MLPLEALSTMKIMVATPAFGFNVSPLYVETVSRLVGAGLNVHLVFIGDSHIDRARNKLVALFLAQSDCTHLFFLDADIGATPEAFARLLLADRDVAVGVYPLKQYKWPDGGLEGDSEEIRALLMSYPFVPLNNRLVSDTDGFSEVAEATTGFMCIKRGVFDKLREAYPNLNYVPDWTADDGNHWAFFDAHIDPASRRFLTEDYAFCHLWRSIGGRIWIDLYSKLTHQGPHQWEGNLYQHLELMGLKIQKAA
jgi:hypothetical protein